MHIACLLMLKNEEKRLPVTLQSLKGVVDSLVVYDTGSTDRTLEILNSFCQQTSIPLHLKEGEFTNFCESRNVSLDFADTIDGIDILLLMDCNDEVRNSKGLRSFLKKQPQEQTAWLVKQSWFSGGATTEYFNVRLIRTRKSWRYHGVVHEWIQKTDDPETYTTYKVPELVLFQDRTQDDDKTGKRFRRDLELLLNEHENHPTDARTVFYLAQTYECLGQLKEAYKYYNKRSTMEGFIEEVFHCFLRMANAIKDLLQRKQVEENDPVFHEDNMKQLYLRAFEHTPRVEPLLELGEYYRMKQVWHMAYMFAHTACALQVPTQCILFVNEHDYSYKRYHLLGIVAFYNGQYKVGIEACTEAIKNARDPRFKQIDENNFRIYQEVMGVQQKPAVKIGGRRQKRR